MAGEGKSNKQSCEGGTNRVTKLRAWGNMMVRDHKINKIGLAECNQVSAYKAPLRRNPPNHL